MTFAFAQSVSSAVFFEIGAGDAINVEVFDGTNWVGPVNFASADYSGNLGGVPYRLYRAQDGTFADISELENDPLNGAGAGNQQARGLIMRASDFGVTDFSMMRIGAAGVDPIFVAGLPDQTICYDPDSTAAFESLAAGETTTDTFTYTVDDGNGGTSTATVSVTVTGTNDAPVAVDDPASITETGGATIGETASISGNVVTNDSDVDNGDTPGNGNVPVANIAFNGTPYQGHQPRRRSDRWNQ